MDTLTVLAISENLNRRFAGKEIQGLMTVGRDVFALIFRGVTGGVLLRTAAPAAVYFEESRLKPAREFPPLSGAALLEGAKLEKVEQYADDRIINFELIKDESDLTLVVELFRRPPSIYLLTPKEVAITVYGRRLSGDYSYPPNTLADKIRIGDVRQDEIEEILESDAQVSALRQTISHLSPRAAEYLAGKNGDYICTVLRQNSAAIESGTGVTQLVGERWMAFPSVIFDGYVTKVFDDINDAVRFAATETERVQSLETLKTTIGRSLRNRKKKLEKQRGILAKELAEYEKPERLRELGDLLKTNFARIKKGQESIVVANFFGEGEIEITLDPALSPEANMGLYYKRYKKALRGEEKVRGRLGNIENELVEIEKKLGRIDKAGSIDDISDLAPTPKQGKEKQTTNIVGKRYISSDDFEIVVGRGAKENDAVTFGVGRPGDLWLHAREARGSHVIIRRKEKGKPFPKRTVEEAAALAAFFSKSRNAEIVPVIVTERRYVTKIKGQPGLVRVLQEEVIFVEPGEVLKVKPTGS